VAFAFSAECAMSEITVTPFSVLSPSSFFSNLLSSPLNILRASSIFSGLIPIV
jgi:hypothetical protein